MNNKKGFTLVELLAVIAILAILVIIALPNVINMYTKAKKNTFLTEAQNVIKQSSNKFIQDGMSGKKTNFISNNKNSLNLSGEKIDYQVKLDNKGNVTEYMISNGNYCVSSNKSFDKLTIDDVETNCSAIEEAKDTTVGTLAKNYVELANIKSRLLVGSITFYSDGRVISGAEKYDVSEAQDNSIIMYTEKTENKWWVTINGKSSEENILNLTIVANGKIDLPEDSSSLFSFYLAPSHGPESNLTSITFNNAVETKNVINMYCMFCLNKVTKYDLSGFDTSKVTNMQSMFEVYNMYTPIEFNLSSFNTSNVINMSRMFRKINAESLDLSSFEINDNADLSGMFSETNITNAYAKNTKMMNKLNSISGNPTKLKFAVK